MSKEKDVVEEALRNQIAEEINILNDMEPGEDKLNQAKVISELTNSSKSWTSSLLEKLYKKKEVIIAAAAATGTVLMAIAKGYEVKARKDINLKVLDYEEDDVVTSRAYNNK